jgi:general L-amino acid transport system substrate-binding protein
VRVDGITSELNLANYFKANGITYKALVFDRIDQAIQAYLIDRCDANTADSSGPLRDPRTAAQA